MKPNKGCETSKSVHESGNNASKISMNGKKEVSKLNCLSALLSEYSTWLKPSMPANVPLFLCTLDLPRAANLQF